MFKIEEKTIHCSRGDAGTINFRLPMVDTKNFIKYVDNNSPANIYWYDYFSKKLYDSNYEESDIDISTLTMVLYEFQVGDIIKFNVYEKRGYDKEPLLTKIIIVETVSDNVDIPLTESDTTFGELINKPTIFWWDISLNEDMTVIGYDEDAAKEFILYPAKGAEE